MKRVFKLKTPLLALFASVVVEAVFIAVFFTFRSLTVFGDPLNLVSWIFLQFHTAAGKVADRVSELFPSYWQNVVSTNTTDICTSILVFIIGTFQWYIVFFLTIGVCRFASRKFSSKPQIGAYFLLALLAGLLVSSVFLNAYFCWKIYGTIGWRNHVVGSARTQAWREESDDFREKHFRIYRLGEATDEAKYTGTNDGPFQVWNVANFPEFGSVERFSVEKFIECYNESMTNMYLERQKQSKVGAQHRATNGSSN